MTKKKSLAFATNCVHGSGRQWDTSEYTFSAVAPIFQTATFGIKDPKYAAEIIGRGGETYFKGEDYIYSRGGNPSQRDLEIALQKLEEAEGAICFSSGMAAISALALTILKSGDHVVCTNMVFGDTHFLFAHFLKKFGVETSFVDTSDIKKVKTSLQQNTKLVFVETPANPKLIVTDLKKLSKTVHKFDKNIVVAVDNTFATSYLQKPLALGCDLVIYSTTKGINGHTDAVGGAAIGGKKLLSQLRLTLFATGAVLDPFAAWLTLRGLKTLPLRIERQCQTTNEIFKFLSSHDKVEAIFYPGDPKNPAFKIAKKQMKHFGCMIALQLKGDFKKSQKFIRQLKLFTFAVSLGSVESLVSHPASMTHAIMNQEEREAAGIPDNLVRLSIGLENSEDLIADLKQALDKI